MSACLCQGRGRGANEVLEFPRQRAVVLARVVGCKCIKGDGLSQCPTTWGGKITGVGSCCRYWNGAAGGAEEMCVWMPEEMDC